MTTVTTSPSDASSPEVENTETEVDLSVEQAVETSPQLPSESDSTGPEDDASADAPAADEDAALDATGDDKVADGIQMTESLWQKTYTAMSPAMRLHPSTYWRTNVLEKLTVGGEKREEWVTHDSLWAPWAPTSTKLLRHWDAGTDSWEELYQVTLEGANGATTLDLTTEHLMDVRHLNEATVRAGGLAQMNDHASPAHGSAVMQFRTYVHKLAKDSEAVATTNRLGRMDADAGIDGAV